MKFWDVGFQWGIFLCLVYDLTKFSIKNIRSIVLKDRRRIHKKPLDVELFFHSYASNTNGVHGSVDGMAWKVSIHVFAWRRMKSLKRLCDSLLRASYSRQNVPIYFHVDGGALPSVIQYVNEFTWPNGERHLNIRADNLGMPASILNGWIPKSDEEYAIMLEDDVEVSPAFFEYTLYCLSLMTYKRLAQGEEHGMIGCSLYTPRVNEIGPAPNAWSPPAWNPAKEVTHRNRIFYFQLPCSWGAVYHAKYWRQFLEYYAIRQGIKNFPETPNSRSNEWFSSWKRILIELMLFKGWYMLYPNFVNQASFSTNYFEKGIHSVGEGKIAVTPDEIKKNGDRRFTVPLLNDFKAIRSSLPILTIGIVYEIPYVNLYHQRVENGRKDLYLDPEPFMKVVNSPEWKHFLTK